MSEHGIEDAYQSRMSTFLTLVSCWVTLTATDTLLKKQKPMCSSGSEWWPGGRTIAKDRLTAPLATASVASMTPPQLRRAASGVLGLT